MTIELFLWLLVIFVQTALLGITMYTLICLSDLENDFINPHDASERINRCVIPELCLSVALTVLCTGSLHFVLIGLASVMCAWTMRDYSRGCAFVDVTEIFRSCSREKKRRVIKLVAHMVLFVFSIFKLVSTIVATLISDDGVPVTKLLKMLMGY